MTKVIKSLQEINERSTVLAKSAKDLGKDIHSHLMDILYFIVNDAEKSPTGGGNVEPASRFLKLIQNNTGVGGKSVKAAIIRTDAVKAWLEEFAFCRKYSDDTGFKFNRAAFEKRDPKHAFHAAQNPWYKFTPEKPYSRWNLKTVIESAYKTANEKKSERGPNGELNYVPPELHAKLKELYDFLDSVPDMPKDYKATPPTDTVSPTVTEEAVIPPVIPAVIAA